MSEKALTLKKELLGKTDATPAKRLQIALVGKILGEDEAAAIKAERSGALRQNAPAEKMACAISRGEAVRTRWRVGEPAEAVGTDGKITAAFRE